jgi:hypothetical protein
MPAWSKAEESEGEVADIFQSNAEPRRGLEPFEDWANRRSLRVLERQSAGKGREGCSALPFLADEDARQPNHDRPRYGTGNVGRQRPALHQINDRLIAYTKTAEKAGAAGQYGDVRAGNRIVSRTAAAVWSRTHRGRRRRHEFWEAYLGQFSRPMIRLRGKESPGPASKRRSDKTGGHRGGPFREIRSPTHPNRTDQSAARHSGYDGQEIDTSEWQDFLLVSGKRRG